MDYSIQTPKQLGNALRSERKCIKLSQNEAAKLVGLLPKTISNLENNPATSNVESLFKLLSALNMNITLSPKTDAGNQSSDLEW